MRRNITFGVACVAAVGAYAIGSNSSDDDDVPGRQLSPTEAACEMIADGDTAVEAFDVLVGLDVPELTASRAVNRAIAGDC